MNACNDSIEYREHLQVFVYEFRLVWVYIVVLPKLLYGSKMLKKNRNGMHIIIS